MCVADGMPLRKPLHKTNPQRKSKNENKWSKLWGGGGGGSQINPNSDVDSNNNK